MRANNSSLSFWTGVDDGQNNPSLTVGVETETGKPVALLIRDRESLEVLARVHVPQGAAMGIGQALMLADSLKVDEAKTGGG